MPFGNGAYRGTTKKPTRRGITIIPLSVLRVKAFFHLFSSFLNFFIAFIANALSKKGKRANALFSLYDKRSVIQRQVPQDPLVR